MVLTPSGSIADGTSFSGAEKVIDWARLANEASIAKHQTGSSFVIVSMKIGVGYLNPNIAKNMPCL